MQARHSLWLLPEEPAPFDRVIAELAVRFEAVRFDPHLTLLGEVSDPAALREGLRKLAASARPLALPGEAIECGQGTYRALFLRFSPSPALLTLRARAAAIGARISHQDPAAAADRPVSSGGTLSALLDVPSSTPRPSSVGVAPIHGHIDRLATDPGEQCGPGGPKPSEFVPHLSLLYVDRPEAERRAHVERIAARLPRQVRFTKLRLVRTEGPPGAWRNIAEEALSERGGSG
jgi:2'-5' RNA ligase